MLLQPYQKDWENDFNAIKQVLEGHIPITDFGIEHVGSTSVKGLAAKPVIDIDLIYENPESFKEIKWSLEKLAYYHNGDQGIPGREVFKRSKVQKHHLILDSITHHLYVCHSNNDELDRHLRFRDYLRQNEKERIAYESLKYRIAEMVNQDRKEYAKLKIEMARAFVETVIRKSKGK